MSLPFLNTAPGYDEELRNSVFFERGLHATSICGAVGATVAVAMLQGQDEAGIASAIAASRAPACWRPTAPAGPSIGPLRLGRALRRGSGRPGPARAHRPADRAGGPLRVPAGVLRRPRPPGRRRPRPGHGLELLPRVVFKPYPCNHFTHAGVDAALRLRAQGLAPADVTAIELASPSPSCARSPSHPRPRHGRPPGTTRRSAALHGRRGAARRRPRRVPRGLHRRRRP
jgi:2-methylcitrate dehydratase PrpD